ncbi:hypothetical protein D9756_006464 [Leucocoprinus leucothites]|uniref:Uncharacterized protein n=1 Tax=Leucocoprinus leucothites TaxID=201217 RepID=A0A8H5G1Y8_9AGAR|nr:hypothetical protein D9756_006464 [Leucoagaricus leucothites]
MTSATPTNSSSRTPPAPSPVAAPGSFGILPTQTRSSNQAVSPLSQNVEEKINVSRPSDVIHNAADAISALFTQEAQKLVAEIERSYTMKLDEEKKRFSEILEHERRLRSALEDKILALEKQLARNKP